MLTGLASAMTSGNDGEDSVSDLIGRAVRELSSVSSYDSDIEDLKIRNNFSQDKIFVLNNLKMTQYLTQSD